MCIPSQLLYTGSGLVFGITAKNAQRGKWEEVPLPEKSMKVEHCSCNTAGTFSLVVSDKGAVYFGGLRNDGKAGELRNGWCKRAYI